MIRDILRPTLIITAVALVCVIVLSQVRQLTAPVLAARAKERQAQALALALPGFDMGEARTSRVDGKEFTWWQGEKQEEGKMRKGYAFLTKGHGYSGDIESMVGVDEAGVVLGLSIISQSETPGLGDRCVEIAYRETLWDHLRKETPFRDLGDGARIPWFQNQFNGIRTDRRIEVARRGDWTPGMREDLLAMNAISALSGASVTTEAVVKSVEEGMALLAKAKQEAGAGPETKK